MKIYRGPQTSDRWAAVTDVKPLEEWARNWRPNNIVVFDGTIDKSGQRHTDLGVQIDASDIVALFNGLVAHYSAETERLEGANANLQQTHDTLQTALEKIDNLISYHQDEAPSVEELIASVQTIARKYRWSSSRNESPQIGWIDWESI